MVRKEGGNARLAKKLLSECPYEQGNNKTVWLAAWNDQDNALNGII